MSEKKVKKILLKKGNEIIMSEKNKMPIKQDNKNILEEKLILDVRDMAKILGVGMNTMYALISTEGFPKIRIGRQYKVFKSAFLEWLEKSIGMNISLD